MQMFMQRQNYNLDVQKFKDDSRHKWAMYDLAKDKAAWDRYTWSEDFKFKTKQWLAEHQEPVITTTTLPTGTTAKTIDDQWKVASNAADLMHALKAKYAARLFPNMNEEEQKKAFSDLQAKYDTNPNANYSPDQIEYLEQHRKAFNDMMAASNLAKGAETAGLEKEHEKFDWTNPFDYAFSKVGREGAKVSGMRPEEMKKYREKQYQLVPEEDMGGRPFFGSAAYDARKKKIEQRIKEEGITVAQAAADAGVSSKTIYNWMRSKTISDGSILEISRLKRENRE